MIEIITFAKAVITVTARPITIAGLSCDVTARAEQMPSTWTRIGLSRFRGLVKAALFSFENNLIILFLLLI